MPNDMAARGSLSALLTQVLKNHETGGEAAPTAFEPEPIPNHIHDNWNATDYSLGRAAGLFTALKLVVDDILTQPDPTSEMRNALDAMLLTMGEALQQVDMDHAREWVGLGGKDNRIDAADVPALRGEV